MSAVTAAPAPSFIDFAGYRAEAGPLPNGKPGICVTDLIKAMGLDPAGQNRTLRNWAEAKPYLHETAGPRLWLPLELLLPWLLGIHEGRIGAESVAALRAIRGAAYQQLSRVVQEAFQPQALQKVQLIQEIEQEAAQEYERIWEMQAAIRQSRRRIAELNQERAQLLEVRYPQLPPKNKGGAR